MFKLKKWEIALLCALILTLLLTPVLGAPGCAWWGPVYPELTQEAAAQSALSTLKSQRSGTKSTSS